MLSILFLIRSLGQGGAERQLVTLAKGLASKGHRIQILVFYGRGELEKDLLETNIAVYQLEKASRWDVLAFLFKCYRAIRKSNPDILHSYLVTANTIATLLKPMLLATEIVWGVRAANMNLENYDWVARWSYRIENWLSPFADLIICNSESGRNHAIAKGFPGRKIAVISNGIDTEHFKPDLTARNRGRALWGVTPDEFLIGLVARIDPIKGYETFLRAAAKYAKDSASVRFICVGDGPKKLCQELQQLSDSLGLRDRLIWAGGQDDMVMVYNTLDLVTSSSHGESFSNVIGEAMSCGVPCVVTNVGDSAQIVAETGHVIPSGDENALVAAWKLLDRSETRQKLGELARARVCEHFSLASMIETTEKVLLEKALGRNTN